MTYVLKYITAENNGTCKLEIVETLPADLCFKRVYHFETRKEAEEYIRDYKHMVVLGKVVEVFHLPILCMIKVADFVRKLGKKL